MSISSISGCTACQLGGTEALQAYDRAYQARLDAAAKQAAAKQEAASQSPQTDRERANGDNRPIAGAIVGSIINISA